MSKQPQVQLKMRIWILPVLLGITLLMGIFFSYRGWWIVFLAFGLAFAFSTYMIRQLKKGFEIQREMRYGWAKVGDVLEERILVFNNSAFPAPWLEIQDHTNIPGHQQAIGTGVDAHNQTVWRTRHLCSRRGLYHLGPTSVETADLFNIFHLSIFDPTEANILITPPVVPLPHIEVASGGRTGDGKLSTGILEQSVAVSTVRDYQPQDPLHHIHWPLTAKRNELTTRVFDNTPTGNWWIVQDMNEAVQAGDDQNNSLEIGIILSASLVNKGIQTGRAVGFIANDRHHTWIPAQHAGDQTMRILRALALCEAGSTRLDDLLEKSRSAFHQSASLVIITPDISLQWWESLLWLKAKGLIPTVMMLDPASFGADGSAAPALYKLHNAHIPAYSITADMFADQLSVEENPLWEWRVFGTGYAVPVRKPANPDWKRLS